MTDKKPFGIWMDTKHATIVGNDDTGTLNVLAYVTVEEVTPASGNKHINNQKKK